MIMVDATHLKVHKTACSLVINERNPLIGMIKGGRNTKLHTICDRNGRPIMFLIGEGRKADIKGVNGFLEKLCHLPHKVVIFPIRAGF